MMNMSSQQKSLVAQSRRKLTALVGSMVMVVGACGSAGGSNSAQPFAEETPLSASTDELSGADTPEYGASLDEFLGVDGDRPTAGSQPPDGFKEIQWDDLVPPGSSEAEISARFDERIAEVEPGSPEADAVFAELQAEFDNQPINPELAGDAIQLAGFVAPLTYADELITEFLLVPYFGACVHVPPPPVNQTVLVTLEDGEGLTFDESWGAVWVAGILTADGADTDLATAGYSIKDAQTGVYDDY